MIFVALPKTLIIPLLSPFEAGSPGESLTMEAAVHSWRIVSPISNYFWHKIHHDTVLIIKEKDHLKNINMLSEIIKAVINALTQLPLENREIGSRKMGNDMENIWRKDYQSIVAYRLY